jgi:hypothetical protein
MPKSRRADSDPEGMDREVRETCKILESVAKRYPPGSAEHEAIRRAAEAFIYLRLHESLKSSYEAFRQSSTKPLTKAQRQTLKEMGVKL